MGWCVELVYEDKFTVVSTVSGHMLMAHTRVTIYQSEMVFRVLDVCLYLCNTATCLGCRVSGNPICFNYLKKNATLFLYSMRHRAVYAAHERFVVMPRPLIPDFTLDEVLESDVVQQILQSQENSVQNPWSTPTTKFPLLEHPALGSEPRTDLQPSCQHRRMSLPKVKKLPVCM